MKSAELGNASAQFALANIFSNGEVVEQDLKEARKWLKLSAEQDYPEAEFLLALWYFQGAVFPKDNDKFLEWLNRAATHGVRAAQRIQSRIDATEEDVDTVVARYFSAFKRAKMQQTYVKNAAKRAKGEYDAKNRPPQPIHVRTPSYPSHLLDQDIHGTVMLELLVDEQGYVAQVEIAESFHSDFDQPTIDAVQGWRFKPALKDGNPVAKRIRLPIRY